MNLASNGGFEQFTTRDNLWDGVDNDGYLAAERRSLPVLTESGQVGDVAMPVSVAAADLNGDGLVDIMTADPTGWMRVYFNRGSKEAAAFTHAEVVPLFLSRGDPKERTRDTFIRRYGPRIALYDFKRRGAPDLVVGNYIGEIMIIENKGSGVTPNFQQPADVGKAVLPTTASGETWGNMFAPAVADFDKDGNPDLLVGEGSYSANAVHLLRNEGSGAAPKFSEKNRFYLCYGDGREQLTPAVVDYNNDGHLDVLVADRKGTVAVHLNDGNWKPGKELKNASMISFGSATSVGGIITVATADINGDGLFDLLIGKNNGRVALSLNKGIPGQPKFDPLVDLKGEDLWKRNVFLPTGWTVDWGASKGNMYGYIASLTDAEDQGISPPEGKRALKIGYLQSPSRIFRPVPMQVGARGEVPFNEIFGWIASASPQDAASMGSFTATNSFTVHKTIGRPPVPGKTYVVTFKVKGQGFTGRYAYAYHGYGKMSQDRVTTGERGRAERVRDDVSEVIADQGNISPSATWTTVTKQVTIRFPKAKELNDPDNWKGVGKPAYGAILHFSFEVRPFDGVVYLDDVQVVEKI